MRCISCLRFSLKSICKDCLNNLSIIDSKRILQNNLKVYAPLALSEARWLIASKYSYFGSSILKPLSSFGLKEFFTLHPSLLKSEDVLVVAIDERLKGAYSHTSIILKEFKSYGFKIKYNALHLKNHIHFSNLNKAQRARYKREFKINLDTTKYKRVIICDDVITTGTTMLQASLALESLGVKCVFGFCLCDARF